MNVSDSSTANTRDPKRKRTLPRTLTQQVFVVRHDDTELSLSGQHTGVAEVPLTERGRAAARRMGRVLSAQTLELVLTSPLQRARDTCALAGLGVNAEINSDLREWDYGEYEGLTPKQIRAKHPSWLLFRDGAPGGERAEHVGARIDRVIAEARVTQGNVAVFAHGHVLRVFAARWIGLPATAGGHFLLDTATLNILSYYHGVPAIKRWNAPLLS